MGRNLLFIFIGMAMFLNSPSVQSQEHSRTRLGIGSLSNQKATGQFDFGTVTVGIRKASNYGDFRLYCQTFDGYNCSPSQSVHAGTLSSNSSQFKITDDNCSGRMLFGAVACTFTVVFAPTSSGAKSGIVKTTGDWIGEDPAWLVQGVGYEPSIPVPPSPPTPPSAGTAVPRVEAPVCAKGSVIDVDNQVFGEEISISGTPYKLYYWSDRVPGRRDLFDSISIQVPPFMGFGGANVQVESQPLNIFTPYNVTFVNGADAKFNHSFVGFTGLNEVHLYNDSDPFYKVHISYPNGSQSNYMSHFGGWQARGVGLGGWNLSVHHKWQAMGQTIYFGHGGSRHISDFNKDLDGNFQIGSQDGREVYIFGKPPLSATRIVHLRTVDSFTGADKYVFTYFPFSSKVASVTDAWGKVTTFVRDGSSGDIKSVQSPTGLVTKLDLNSRGWLKKVTDPIGRCYEMSYDEKGLLGVLKKPNGHVTYAKYNSDGTLKSDIGSGGTLVDLTKTLLSNGWKIDVKSALNRTESHTVVVSNRDSDRISVDSSGLSSRNINRPTGVSTQSFPEGYSVETTLASDSRLRWASPFAKEVVTTISRSRMRTKLTTSVENTLSNNDTVLSLVRKKIDTKIDDNNQKIWRAEFGGANRSWTTTSPMGVYTSKRVDSKGNTIWMQPGNGAEYSFAYDSRGRLVSDQLAGRIPVDLLTRTYDSHDRVATITDNTMSTTSFEYDLVGRVKKQILPTTEEILYTYDDADNLTSVQSTGRTSHSLFYNALGLLSHYLPPALGGYQDITRYEYNRDRQLTKAINPDGSYNSYSFDVTTGRLSKIESSEGVYVFQYSPFTGQNSSLSSPYQVSNIRSYLGPLLISDSMSFNGVFVGAIDLEYTYDMKIGKVKNRAASSNLEVDVEYDLDGRVKKLGPAVFTYETGTNRVKSLVLGGVTDDHVSSRGGQNDTILSSYKTPTGIVLPTVSYIPTRRSDEKIVSAETKNFGSETYLEYSYDSLGRLTGSVDNTEEMVSSYSYDAQTGNRTSSTFNGVTYASTYNAQDQMLTFGPNQYAYTLNGERSVKTNVQSGHSFRYEYDSFGNLKSVQVGDKTISYIYDARNRRIGRKMNGVVTNWWLYQDQTRVGASLDAEGQIIASYFYGTKRNVPDYALLPGGVVYRIISTAAGSPISVINSATGVNVEKLSYTDFGVPNQAPSSTPFGFGGGVYDPDTKLLHFGARDYDPEAGVWLQKDPVRLAGGDINVYRYVADDPINFVDPTGLWSFTGSVFTWLGGGSLTFGVDNHTDRPFLTMRFGAGLGGGFSFDEKAGAPFEQCKNSGMDVAFGLFGDISASNLGTEVGATANAGFSSKRDMPYYAKKTRNESFGDNLGVGGGFSIGVELSFF